MKLKNMILRCNCLVVLIGAYSLILNLMLTCGLSLNFVTVLSVYLYILSMALNLSAVCMYVMTKFYKITDILVHLFICLEYYYKLRIYRTVITYGVF